MRNYKLDTTLLPEVWVTWLTSNGRIWMNKGGVRQKHAEPWMNYENEHSLNSRYCNNNKIPFGNQYSTRNSDKLWVAAGSQLYYAYAKYHKDIDRLEIAAVRYDTTRSESKHTWLYDGDRFFIGKDKSIINQNGNPIYGYYNVKKRGSAYDAREMLSMIMRLTHSDKFINEFKKFIGRSYFIIGNGTSVEIQYGWHIQKWFDSVQKVRTSGKTQKLVDELTNIPLGSIDGLECKYAPKLKENCSIWENQYIDNIIYFERVNDEWSVLRALVRNDDGLFDEAWRVYLGEDGTSRIASKSNNEWIPSSQHRGYYFRKSYYFANKEEAMEKCNRIKYIAPIIASNNGIEELITTLRFPYIEQLYKMGYKKLALHLAHSSTPKADIKTIFGEYYKEKEKNVLRQIGLTKHQLDKYDSICIDRSGHYSPWRGNVLKKMRELFGEDLSHIDNTTYDKYLEAFFAMTDNFWAERYINNLNIDLSRFWRNLVRLADKNSESYRIMSDTLSLYNRLNVTPDIDWFFDDYSDLVRVHDALNELVSEQERERMAYYNMAEAERRRLDDAKREKVDKERRCYEYEDENFIIRLPKDVNEIISEGSRQSICIGGYTTRHSRGETNLFFLRRKNDPTAPFYAIEMNNSKVIVQIHGFGNKWLGNNPEAIPTVVRWLRKNGIKCDEKILTCTARGYRSTADYIPMPIVD